MSMIFHEIGKVVILEPKGRLDATTAKSFKETIKEWTDKGAIKLVVDLGGVNFVDSSGLGVMVSCLKSVTGAGGDLKVARVRPEIQSLFALTRLNKIFDMFDAVEDAAAAF